jgi:hypothetical protein
VISLGWEALKAGLTFKVALATGEAGGLESKIRVNGAQTRHAYQAGDTHHPLITLSAIQSLADDEKSHGRGETTMLGEATIDS